ncbi:MAG: sodium:calcium antiporter, partial [Zetaproteobacteria bacterium]
GARLFVRGVEGLSAWLGISALVVSLLIVPIATELPEKVNSVLWIRRGKDTLAFGNITGAMVFQGTLIPAIGMLLTPWRLARADALVPACLALAGAGLIAWWAAQKALTPRALLVHFGLYLVYAGFVAFAMA